MSNLASIYRYPRLQNRMIMELRSFLSIEQLDYLKCPTSNMSSKIVQALFGRKKNDNKASGYEILGQLLNISKYDTSLESEVIPYVVI